MGDVVSEFMLMVVWLLLSGGFGWVLGKIVKKVR